jgi:hypothetical protein
MKAARPRRSTDGHACSHRQATFRLVGGPATGGDEVDVVPVSPAGLIRSRPGVIGSAPEGVLHDVVDAGRDTPAGGDRWSGPPTGLHPDGDRAAGRVAGVDGPGQAIPAIQRGPHPRATGISAPARRDHLGAGPAAESRPMKSRADASLAWEYGGCVMPAIQLPVAFDLAPRNQSRTPPKKNLPKEALKRFSGRAGIFARSRRARHRPGPTVGVARWLDERYQGVRRGRRPPTRRARDRRRRLPQGREPRWSHAGPTRGIATGGGSGGPRKED